MHKNLIIYKHAATHLTWGKREENGKESSFFIVIFCRDFYLISDKFMAFEGESYGTRGDKSWDVNEKLRQEKSSSSWRKEKVREEIFGLARCLRNFSYLHFSVSGKTGEVSGEREIFHFVIKEKHKTAHEENWWRKCFDGN